MDSIIWPEEFPILETERLTLRQVTASDSGDLYRCYSDPAVMKYMATPLDNEEAVTGIMEDYRDGFKDGYNLVWAIEIKKSETFAGTAGFEGFSFLDNRAEVGFSLLSEQQGMGYMVEALRSIIDYGFQYLHINRIQTTVVPENASSIKLLEKLSFLREGHLKQSVIFNNSYHDELIYGALREKGK